MELSDLDQHPLADKIPVRLPVWWCRTGDSGPHPDVEGCTGNVLFFDLRKIWSHRTTVCKLMRAPHGSTTLLDKNSVLWELCNGRRTFAEVCEQMNATFHEDVSPVVHRTHAGIQVFIGLNVMRFVDRVEILIGTHDPENSNGSALMMTLILKWIQKYGMGLGNRFRWLPNKA